MPTATALPYRVLSLWDPALPPVYGALNGIAELDVRPPDRDWLLAHIGEYDAYLATLHLPFDRELAERGAAGRLRLVYSPSTGTDHLDLAALADCGIAMYCIKDELALLDQVTSSAEHALALLLAVARKLPTAHASALRGDWARDRLRGMQLAGKTLGVLGVGRLGRMMVGYGRALGMTVIGCDPAPTRPLPDLDYLTYADFAARADIVSIHVHLDASTERLLDAPHLAALKPGAILINTSRGGLIDETALLAALQSGHIGGFGTDVIDGEWRTDLEQHPLIAYAREHDHIIITPHIGGVTHEAQAITHRFVVERLAAELRRRLAR